MASSLTMTPTQLLQQRAWTATASWLTHDVENDDWNGTASASSSDTPTAFQTDVGFGYDDDDAAADTRLSTAEAVTFAVVMSALIVATIVGNILVALSVFTYLPLKTVPNFFVASLACADLAVAILVMPFSVANFVGGRWMFGRVWCLAWLTFDILTCTASILHLCAIALDRYHAIHDPIAYAIQRTRRRVVVKIAVVWTLSAVISVPPLVGWNGLSLYDPSTEQCQLTNDRGFVVYSAAGSFYIPLAIMTVVYARIFRATRARLRARAKATAAARLRATKTATAASTTTTTTTLAASIQPTAQTMTALVRAVTAHAAATSVTPTDAAGPSCRHDNEPISSNGNGNVNLVVGTMTEVAADNDNVAEQQQQQRQQPEVLTPVAAAVVVNRRPQTLDIDDSSLRPTPPNDGGTQHHLSGCQRQQQQQQQQQHQQPTQQPHHHQLVVPLVECDDVTGNSSPTLTPRVVRDIAVVVGAARKNGSKGPPIGGGTRYNVPKGTPVNRQLYEFMEEKQRISLSKERRAARTMAIIMGAFVACWLPFFLMYVVFPFCDWCAASADIRLVNFIVWLGYVNSALNPVIYTVFNVDFRRAFQNLLTGRCHLST